MTTIRKRIAERLVHAQQTAAILTRSTRWT